MPPALGRHRGWSTRPANKVKRLTPGRPQRLPWKRFAEQKLSSVKPANASRRGKGHGTRSQNSGRVKSQIAHTKRPRSPQAYIPLAVRLAYRNLFHGRLSFFATIVGIVFSVVLVAVQSGIYLGSQKKIAAIIDAAPADLWIVPLGTKSYDDPSFLSGRERYMAFRLRACKDSEDMVVSFARWRKPEGGTNTVLLSAPPAIAQGASMEHRRWQPRKRLMRRAPSPSTRVISPISA